MAPKTVKKDDAEFEGRLKELAEESTARFHPTEIRSTFRTGINLILKGLGCRRDSDTPKQESKKLARRGA